MAEASSSPDIAARADSIADLPDDELLRFGRELGLELAQDTPRGQRLRLIRQRQELIRGLDRDALLDIVMWVRWPVRREASNDELARIIIRSTHDEYETLTCRGLDALARLRGVEPGAGESREALTARIRRAEGLGARFRRLRRSVIGSLLSRVLEPAQDSMPRASASGEYHFLPDEERGDAVRRRIENEGVVGGIARTLRGVADDYVREKLDEIERRIDAKLDQIDERMQEWRDRELANRIRLMRITLVTAVIVAVISLGYHYVQSRAVPNPTQERSVHAAQSE
ncbi:MAG: hypothetical protein C4547_12755 [Phycisphaerales bacterium]|nr:MAG: hypothetical protein C4547_12755 [Phycisphaerales bacterium]